MKKETEKIQILHLILNNSHLEIISINWKSRQINFLTDFISLGSELPWIKGLTSPIGSEKSYSSEMHNDSKEIP